jgi:hypothetical protein
MLRMVVKVSIPIIKLIPGPLLGIVRDTGGTFYLLIVLVIGILLLGAKGFYQGWDWSSTHLKCTHSE